MRKYLFLILFCLPYVVMAQLPLKSNKRILIVVSSYGKENGKVRPGYEFDEFSQAWLIFKLNGIEMDVASPKGGKVEADEFNINKKYNALVLADNEATTKLYNTIPTKEVDASQYVGIYIVGGKGAMFDLPFDPSLQDIISKFAELPHALIATVCHGTAALVNIKMKENNFLVTGIKLTGFSNEEEIRFGKKWRTEFPFLLEDMLVQRGAIYQKGESMLPFVVIDKNFVSGQNPYSTFKLAEEFVKLLGVTLKYRKPFADENSMKLISRALQGELFWAKGEIVGDRNKFDLPLIAAFGYYKLIYANRNIPEIKQAIDIIRLVEDYYFQDEIHFKIAETYHEIDEDENAKRVLQRIVQRNPNHKSSLDLLKKLNE